MIILNATSLIAQFIQRYQIWCDHQMFYEKRSHIKISSDVNGIPCYHYTDIDSITQDTTNLVCIDMMTEGWHSHSWFLRYPQNKRYIFFTNGTWDKNKKQLPYEYDIVDTAFFIFEMVDTHLSPHRFSFYSDKIYDFGANKPMTFVSTIGNTKPIRDCVVKYLLDKLNYKNFILKYSGRDLGQPSTEFDVISVRPGEFDPYTNIEPTYYHNISQTLPMKMYNQARFNLVTETDIEETDQFFLTEKTLKCLITGMPFVVVATPGFLSNLRDLGFFTYSSLWDESYDQISDPKQRINEIVDLCNHLHEFDWQHHQQDLQTIALLNQRNFMHLNHVSNMIFSKFESTIKTL